MKPRSHEACHTSRVICQISVHLSRRRWASDMWINSGARPCTCNACVASLRINRILSEFHPRVNRVSSKYRYNYSFVFFLVAKVCTGCFFVYIYVYRSFSTLVDDLKGWSDVIINILESTYIRIVENFMVSSG